ncbi:MAG TPA: FAD-binding oxidoreductase [Candidatus Acidoferrum sp.]|nr:FAD-binding oxidoreductase [Candidatus Acidoferrum sp.]
MVSDPAIQKFRTTLRGQSYCPGEPGYDATRAIPNAMIDRRPALIVRCSGAGDVIACVQFAQEQDALVSVRGGGHSVAGKSVCDSGLMIDLSAMKGIRVDPKRKMVRAEAGLTLGEFDRETQAFGLATTLGTISKTGISGLTLGAGWGHLHGKYGLALDNLTGLDVVTADGRLLTASATENQDLFWGLRGSGGNLGIVTSLEYQLHEVRTVLAGAVLYPLSFTKEALRFFREWAQTIPDELVIQCASLTFPELGRIFAIAGAYNGDLKKGEDVLKPLRALGKPLLDIFQPMPYVQLQSMFDPWFPPGRLTYVKSNFLKTLNDNAADVISEFLATCHSPHTFAPGIEHWHGAVTRAGVHDTAFPHRTNPFNFMIWSNWEGTENTEKNVRWTRDFWSAMKPCLIESSYGNYVSDEGDESARAAYGVNYDRLAKLKAKYDPANLFRMNHNIAPEKTAQATTAD